MASIEHSANFFLHISSFTRHLLDDILPVELYHKPSISSDIVENLIKECDALIGSLQNFKTKTNAIQRNEAASLLHGLNIEDNVKFNKLCESFMEKIVTISDIIKYKPLYCKICDLTTLEENVYVEHCSSLKHIQRTNQTVEPLTVFKCNQCYMVLIAPQSTITGIKLLSSHCKLDEHIKKLKEANEKGQRMSITNKEQILAGSNSDLRKLGNSLSNSTKSINAEMNITQVPGKNKKNIGQRSSASNSQNSLIEIIGDAKKSVIPPKVNQALKFIRKKLRAEKRFPDYLLHYCNVCEVVVNSTPSYIQHNSSKQHIAAVSNATRPINLFKCERCKVVITGYQAVIDDIIKSDVHKEIDEWAKTLKTFPLQKQETGAIKTEHSGLDSTAKANIPSQQGPKEVPISLKDSLSYMYEIITKANFRKNAIFYCLVCDRRIDSIQNLMQHTNAKKHILLRASLTLSPRFYQCAVCLIGLFGTESEVSDVINSIEHINLDQKINSFKSIESSVTDIKERGDTPTMNVTKRTEMKPTNVNTIPTKFFTFNAKLLNGCFTKSGFCRVCNIGVLIKNGWAIHVNCKKHIAKSLETEASKNLIPLLCKFCPFQIIGDQQYGNVCMNAHMKLNHPDGVSIEIKNETDIASGLKQNSVIPSQQYVNSNIKTSNDNLVPNRIQGTDYTAGDYNAQSTVIDKESKIQDETSTVEKINVSSSERNILNLNIFIKFLKKKKNIFLDEGLKQFGGICLICSMVFEDYYMWLIHVKGTAHRDVNQTNIYERECENCNLSLFGERSVIDDELWSLEEHVSLDALISQ